MNILSCRLLHLPLICGIFCGCSYSVYSGELTSKNFNLESYSKIEIFGNFDLSINGEIQSDVVISAPSDAFQNLFIDINEDILKIYHDDVSGNFLKRAEVIIRNDTLSEIMQHGNGSFSGHIKSEDYLKLHLTGTKIELRSESDYLEADMDFYASGSFKGRCEMLILNIESGNRAVDASEMLADSAEVHLIGQGVVVINAAEYLDAHIRGGGSVKYVGNPKINKTIWGVGGEVIPY